MSRKENVPVEDDDRPGNLLALALLAPVVGAAAGLIGALFRLALEKADRLRDALIDWAHGERLLGFLIVAGACAAATLVAASLVRRFSPYASGSGIPHVEAVLNEELPQAPFRIIPVKFVGGVLAIGSGLALGREGPSVQMGASIAHLLGKAFQRRWPDCRVLLAAGAGAGLATAFNAPIAGAVFVLEELVRRFEPRIAIVVLGASATAISVSRVLLGDVPDFHVEALDSPGAEARPLFFVLGGAAGLMGIVYNRTLLATLAAAERLSWWPVEVRAGLIGAAVGTLAWFRPDLIGGGDAITQRTLLGAEALATLPLVFLLRHGLGAVSYAAATPGGLFAPLLVLGAQLGLFIGLLFRLAFPDLGIQPEGFAVVGMAAFFTGVVRAPLTGIVLVTEMTASVTMLLPMLGACFAAMLAPTLLRDPALYDSLRENALRRDRALRGQTESDGP
ncbi:MAG: H(+)/Cl(-) exchange transporter ClcA [Hyphomicrobiales bacterium]|nr:H(+)/Cl(-) exchange transporter ClcA [Hyphomicrobiales bacterium]